MIMINRPVHASFHGDITGRTAGIQLSYNRDSERVPELGQAWVLFVYELARSPAKAHGSPVGCTGDVNHRSHVKHAVGPSTCNHT